MGNCNNHKTEETNSIRIRKKSLEKTENKKNTIEVKVVLLGDQSVGKSSISQRYVKNVFTGTHVATVGGAYLQQKVVLNNGVAIKLHLWDTGGQERFRSMTNLYYRDANAAILTYDITNEQSFTSLNFWLKELKYKIDNEGMILCLAGNKCDVGDDERKVEYNRAKMFAEENNMMFYETSAKNDVGIKDLFNGLLYKLYEQKGTEQTAT